MSGENQDTSNNLSEQAIRENVPIPKIIRTFRLENRSHNYHHIASLFETWKLKDMNIVEKLEKLPGQRLCLSTGTNNG